MTALTGKQINNSYKDLLQVSNSNSGIDATLRDMSDGEGTVGPVKISTTTMQWPAGKILDIDGTFDFGGAATVSGTWAIANGGTGATTALAATQNLGVEVGVDIQAYSAALDSISGLTTAADKMIYTTAADTYAVANLTEAGRDLLDDADAAAQRTTLGLGALATRNTVGTSQIDNNSVTADKLAHTAVTPGSYTKANVTVDQQGRLTAASDGADVVYTAQIATTSGSTKTLETGLPTGISTLEILFNGVSGNTAGQAPVIELGDSGGFETTGYDSHARSYSNSAVGGTVTTTGFPVYRIPVYEAAHRLYGVMRLTRWDESENLWLMQCHVQGDSGTASLSGESVGRKTLSSTLTQIRIRIIGGGAFDNGEARLRYWT